VSAWSQAVHFWARTVAGAAFARARNY